MSQAEQRKKRRQAYRLQAAAKKAVTKTAAKTLQCKAKAPATRPQAKPKGNPAHAATAVVVMIAPMADNALGFAQSQVIADHGVAEERLLTRSRKAAHAYSLTNSQVQKTEVHAIGGTPKARVVVIYTLAKPEGLHPLRQAGNVTKGALHQWLMAPATQQMLMANFSRLIPKRHRQASRSETLQALLGQINML